DGANNRSPTLTADQLCLMIESDQSGLSDVAEFRRASVNAPGGPPIYSQGSDFEDQPCLSADGLQLIFNSTGLKGNGYVGGHDLYLRRRATRDGPWGPPEHLGPRINNTFDEAGASLSANGLLLAFHSDRPGGQGSNDIWISRRA